MWTTTVQPVVIALMVVLEVAVWQVRVALATRGRKRIAAALGAVNAVISVVALGQVVTNLDRPANVVGYAVGPSGCTWESSPTGGSPATRWSTGSSCPATAPRRPRICGPGAGR